jgi:hypothetical protein
MKVVYSSIDRVRIARQFKTLAPAMRFAHKWVGQHPDLAGDRYAISNDGVGKITAEGVTLRELFPEPA